MERISHRVCIRSMAVLITVRHRTDEIHKLSKLRERCSQTGKERKSADCQNLSQNNRRSSECDVSKAKET